MEEHLYLFEVLVDSIYFDESVLEIPQKKQIVVSVKLGNIVTLEIRSETLPVGSQSGNKRLIDFKSGRSHLIPLHKEKLLQDLNSHSLEVNVRGRGDVKPIGSSSAPWDDSFKEMVQESDEEFVTPAFIDDNFCLLENGAIRGNVQMFLRLSCFGKSIQTQFEVLQESGNKQFLFKTPNMATTFICSKYGAGASTDFLPIGPLYNSGHMKPEKVSHPISPSWTAVMHGNSSSTMEKHNSTVSVCLFPEYLSLVPPVKDSAITFDIASLRARPEEDKFLDFLTGKKFGDLQGSLHSFLVSDDEGNERTIFIFDESVKKDTEPTKESKACQCPKTPVYCKHVYAAIEKYEKSHPDLMIYGKRVKYEKILKNKFDHSGEKSDSLLRLRGGDDQYEPYVHKKKKGCYNPCCKMAFKLRGIGKSQVEGIQDVREKDDYFCADFFCPESTRRNIGLQVIFSEEDISRKFNCVNRYCPAAKMFKKLGLGPLANERCQGTLYGPVKPPVQYAMSQTYGTMDTYGPYGIFSETDTPFMQREGKTWIKGSVLRLRGGGSLEVTTEYPSRLRGGTSSKSPIAECQEIMEQLDEILDNYKKALSIEKRRELDLEEYMKPSTTPNCGHPRCTYISEPPLSPIHWDCPDPLPLGICKNPKCPYLPEELKRVERILESRRLQTHTDSPKNDRMKRTSEGNMDQFCPFFNESKILNYMQFDDSMKKITSCSNPKCPLKGIVSSCSNPSCPFAHEGLAKPCSNPSCPLKVLSSCSNPECPFREITPPTACSNPDCPLTNLSSSGACSNPDCPIKKSKDLSEEICQNPDCPLKKESTPIWAKDLDESEECKCNNPNCPDHKETCSNPECPFNLDKAEVCANPKCPYKSRPSSKRGGICGSPQRSVCGDETCAFHEGAGDEGKGDEKREQHSTTGAGDLPGNEKIEGSPVDYTKGDRLSIYDMTPCLLTSCKYMGGKLKCTECAELNKGKKNGPCPKICPGDLKCPLAVDVPKIIENKQPKKEEIERHHLKKARKQYVYHFGDNYPGFHRGHKTCVVDQLIVPAKMGWLWNIQTPVVGLKPRRGWRPGVIAKTVLETIQAHRKSLNMKPLEEIKARRRRRKFGSDSEADIPHPKPTVQIKKKEGVYYITMHPLKDPTTLVPNESPYMETTPLQFRIMKAKETNEYKSCVCNDQGVVYEPESSSSDSELDIEFTPPAGIIRPEKFGKIRNVVHTDTQYDADDLLPPGQEKGKKGKGKEKKDKKGKNKKEKDGDKKEKGDDKNKKKGDKKKK